MSDTRQTHEPLADAIQEERSSTKDWWHVPETPKTAARLAAESAFVAAPALAQQLVPLVTVRGRRISPRLTSGAATECEALAESTSNTNKPRVFLLPSATSGAEEESASSLATGQEIAVARRVEASPRRRRVASDQRPGPVVQVYEAPACAIGVGKDELLPTFHQLAVLSKMLAEIDLLLKAIRQAQEFRIS